MDEEENFAKLLSQSTSAPAPAWSTSPGQSADDPWANPFSDTPSTNPFGSASTTFDAPATFDTPSNLPIASGLPESPREGKSPYVQKLEEDRVILPDPPSVIAAREQQRDDVFSQLQSSPFGEAGYTSPSPYTSSDPFAFGNTAIASPHPQSPFDSPIRDILPARPPQHAQQSPPPVQSPPKRKGLPSDLIDEDLLAASDPSSSLKKAFVKSSPTPATGAFKIAATESRPKAHVFTPKKEFKQPAVKAVTTETEKSKNSKAVEEVGKETKVEEIKIQETDKSSEQNGQKEAATIESTRAEGKESLHKEEDEEKEPVSVHPATRPVDGGVEPAITSTSELTPTNSRAASIPLPASTAVTPTPTRPPTPPPAASALASATSAAATEEETPEPPSSTLSITPSIDRVAVSPLDPPPGDSDYGFQSLAIGASSSTAPPPPSKSPAKSGEDWPGSQAVSPPVSRFGGKGWGALDEDDTDSDGLFGRGGPSVRTSNADSWGASADDGEGGWGEPGVASLSTPGPSQSESIQTPERRRPTTPPRSASASGTPTRTPRTPKLLSKPLFQISVGDPTRVGDPVRGYTVYTVRTRTTSPHYRKGDFSVLRRFSDFLWLFETLTLNNPGVIVPPVPGKHPFGRFQDTFIETRRLALQRSLTKITAHPVLQLDPDLRLFLESDHFATDSKTRRAEIQSDKSSILSGWTGPKFVEQDEWFDNRRAFLDSLESQLKSLSKSIESASKSRLDMAISMGDFASSMSALADSDLGSAMCSALARLADLIQREREQNEEQAKSEVVHLLNLSDEYVRFIGSVRIAFASRIKCYERWQGSEREVVRLRQAREKARQQGKLGDRVNQSLAEIGEAERRSRDASAEFESVSKLVKMEFVRFERERIEEFKRVLERYLDAQIGMQKDLIEAWEEYHGTVLKMAQKTSNAHGQQ